MLHFKDLRLDALEGLAHLGAQAYLPDRKLLEGSDVLHSDAQYRRQDPALVFRVLPVHVTPLPLERVHQQVGDHRPSKVFQGIVPMPVHLRRESDLELLVADGGQRGLVVVEDEVARRLVTLAGEQRRLVKAVEVELVVATAVALALFQFFDDIRFAGCGGKRRQQVRHVDDVAAHATGGRAGPADQERHAHTALPGGALVAPERRSAAFRPHVLVSAVVGRVDDNGILVEAGLSELIQ